MDDVTHRGDFDRAMTERFPKARRTRQETDFGWRECFTVGFLDVCVHVRDRRTTSRSKKDVPFNTIRAEVRAIRTTIDNSKVTVWMKQGGWSVLDDLRAELLGMAHGLVHVSGRRKRPEPDLKNLLG